MEARKETERDRLWKQFIEDVGGWPEEENPKDERCFECYRQSGGRFKNLMLYKGIEYGGVTASTEELDEAAPNGYRKFDRVVRMPFWVWRCSFGHEYTDGY
jgi:hypothetical protein